MSCNNTLESIVLGCVDSSGGIKTVYIANYNETGTTFSADSTNEITGITSSESWYTFSFRPETSFLTETGSHAPLNGTNFWTDNVNMTFHKLETAKRNAISLLTTTDSQLIVKTQNGDYWLVGEVNGANVDASTAQSGQAFGDLNGYTINLAAKEPQMMKAVSAAAVATLTIVP